MFDFTGERPGSLMSIPSSWIVKEPKHKVDKTSWCYWPIKGSTDEQQLKKLIKNCSDPHPKSWSVLPGRIKNSFKSLREAESYVSEKIGTISTTADSEVNKRGILKQLEHEAALQVKKRNVSKPPNNASICSTNKSPPRRIDLESKALNTTPSTNTPSASPALTRSNSNGINYVLIQCHATIVFHVHIYHIYILIYECVGCLSVVSWLFQSREVCQLYDCVIYFFILSISIYVYQGCFPCKNEGT